jgi:hypothetical protein
MALGEFAASLPLGSCCHRRVGVVFNSHLDDLNEAAGAAADGHPGDS